MWIGKNVDFEADNSAYDIKLIYDYLEAVSNYFGVLVDETSYPIHV